jgi:hypothetical protein
MHERRGASAGQRAQESGRRGRMNGSQGIREQRSARNRPGASQTQTESQPGAR